MRTVVKLLIGCLALGGLLVGANQALYALGHHIEVDTCRQSTEIGLRSPDLTPRPDARQILFDDCMASRKAHRLNRWGLGHGHPGD